MTLTLNPGNLNKNIWKKVMLCLGKCELSQEGWDLDCEREMRVAKDELK